MVAERASSPEPAWRASAWKRVQVVLIAAIVAPVLALLSRTLRWDVVGPDPLVSVAPTGRLPIYAFWHGRILPATFVFRNRSIVVMTSENFDGEWIARVIAQFGYGAARGSTSRGGSRALVRLKRDMEAGRPAAFTLDGPRGPARRAQPGALWLAKATGHPLVPFHIEAASHWTVRSWDRTQVPKPFSRVVVAIGEPFFVAAEADARMLEGRRVDLERELERLERVALDRLGLTPASP
jgi:lysophospholipid acyltransferase (LPLAT)-like uncharacterized protein